MRTFDLFLELKCTAGKLNGWKAKIFLNQQSGQIEAEFSSDNKEIPPLGATFNGQYLNATFRGMGNNITIHSLYIVK